MSIYDRTDADVKSRINKARHAFAVLKPIWKSRKITFRTEIRPFNTNVKSLLLYGSECWKITYELARMIQEFIPQKSSENLNYKKVLGQFHEKFW